MKHKNLFFRWLSAFLIAFMVLAFAACDGIGHQAETPVDVELPTETSVTDTQLTLPEPTTATITELTTEVTTTASSTGTEFETTTTTAKKTTAKPTTTTTKATSKTSAAKPTTKKTETASTTTTTMVTTEKTTTIHTTTTQKPTTTTTKTEAVTTTTTAKPSYSPIAWGKSNMKSDFKSIAAGLGYTYDSSLSTGNAHWTSPMYTGSYDSKSAVKAGVKDYLEVYQSQGYTLCNFKLEADTKYPDQPGEYRIYILVA